MADLQALKRYEQICRLGRPEVQNLMLVTFHLAGEHISDTPLGLDDLRCARVAVSVCGEGAELDVDAAIEHVFVHSGRLQKMLAAKRPLRSIEEGDKQRVLAFGQRDVRAVRISSLRLRN